MTTEIERIATGGVPTFGTVADMLQILARELPDEIEIPPGMTIKQWIEFAQVLTHADHGSTELRKKTSYYLGTWISKGEARYGQKYSQALDATEFSHGTLRNYVYVAENVPPENFSAAPSYGVARAVAPVKDKAEQRTWIERAREEGWSESQTRKEIQEAGEQESIAQTNGRVHTSTPEDEGPEITYRRERCPHCHGKGVIVSEVIDVASGKM